MSNLERFVFSGIHKRVKQQDGAAKPESDSDPVAMEVEGRSQRPSRSPASKSREAKNSSRALVVKTSESSLQNARSKPNAHEMVKLSLIAGRTPAGTSLVSLFERFIYVLHIILICFAAKARALRNDGRGSFSLGKVCFYTRSRCVF